ncbi:potassium channel family protein [Microbacterium koreense]|uniref:Potassium channel family protein n=1 Tax=Microbacterium koreense TaxID=323761 RepID=A0ABW2ZNI2_9MICO
MTAPPTAGGPKVNRRRGETPATQRWNAVMYWPLTVAALLFLITYTFHVIADFHGTEAVVAHTLIALTWVVFIVDYLVRLALSNPRGEWFRTHLAALGITIVPPLRPVVLLDAFTRIAEFRRTAGSGLRARLLIYGIGSTLLLIWYISLVVLQAERHAPGATIVSFGDAVWWAFCTVTTVGYGDYVPVTLQGRIAAVVLMAGGVVLVGLIVATISSAVVERVSNASTPQRPPHRRRRRRHPTEAGGRPEHDHPEHDRADHELDHHTGDETDDPEDPSRP